MVTLGDLLAQVSFLAAVAVAGVLVSASMLVVSRDWRMNVIALAVQYFFVVLLLTRQIRLEVAAVKGLVGWLICMVFYLTERRVSTIREAAAGGEDDAQSTQRKRRWMMSAESSFSLLAVILIAVAAYTAALRFPLNQDLIPRDVTLACYLLVGLGLLLVGLSDAPFRVGLGLLTFLSGIDLGYVALEPSLAVAGLLGAVSFLIALAASYLRTAQAAAGEGSLL